MSDGLAELFEHTTNGGDQRERSTDPQIGTKLQAALEMFQSQSVFESADLVDWKPGMRNKTEYGPFIIVRMLAESLVDNDTPSGSSYFREPLDVIAGYFDRTDGQEVFLEMYIDSRRLRLFNGN